MSRRQPWWYVLVAVAASMLAVASAGIAYTNYVQRQADHRWCELLTVLTGAPAPAPGPAGDRSRAVVDLLAKLRRDLGC